MAVYIAVAPLQWRWSSTIDDAIGKSISQFNPGGFRVVNLPVHLYLLNREMNEMSYTHKWALHKDTTYLGTYRAFSKNGSWKWTKYI
jgi:hypothetical protein